MPYKIDVRTDGACRGNGTYGAVAGAAAWFDKPLNGSRGWRRALPEDPTPTNQRAELAGVILALEMATERRRQLDNDPFFILTIRTDSRYAIGCLQQWLEKWRSNGWLNARGKQTSKSFQGMPLRSNESNSLAGFSVVNRDLIEEASDMIDQINDGGRVDFVWIPREQNGDADRLANEACDNQ
ncbi:putative ribonuclease H1 [Mycena galopus ATCC 62051]|nr:putative ribonuclease H1 [Mycena galopus ATCC 62051]